MTPRTIAKCFLMLVMVAFISNCSTVKGWFGKSDKPDKPPEVLASGRHQGFEKEEIR